MSSCAVCVDLKQTDILFFKSVSVFVKLVPTAGHSANEPGIAAELVAACELHKYYLQKGNWTLPLPECKSDDDTR